MSCPCDPTAEIIWHGERPVTLSYSPPQPIDGSGTGRAPATDEAATERAELPDHDANKAPRSMPKPADAGGKAVTTKRRAGRRSTKARAKRREQTPETEQTSETAPATAEKTTKYLIEPNTPATADYSHAKLMSFLKEIGVTDEIEQIAIARMAQVARRRDARGNCVGFGITERGLRVDEVGPLDPDANLLPLTTDDDEHLLPITDWQDVEIEITLDSGCCEHVLDVAEVPGYIVSESPGSRRRQNFIVGNGSKVPNEGQVDLNLQANVDGQPTLLQSCFQVAEITRPLMSVSRICDQGLSCLFTDTEARICDKDGKTVCTFERRGGLYVTTMKLKRPDANPTPSPNKAPFPGQQP